jgi:hypothetical protein
VQPEDLLESLGIDLGYRFITDELAEDGIAAGRKRVNRLCTQQRLWSVH